MDKLLRMDEVLLELRKPPLLRFSTDGCCDATLLVLCAGFEDRSLALVERLVREGRRGFSALVVDYLPEVAENRGKDLIRLLKSAGAQVEQITYDRRDPQGIGEGIADRISRHDGPSIVDISGMSRLLIVQVITALCVRRSLTSVSIAYSEARDYPPTADEFARAMKENPPADVAFLSSGVFELTLVPELSSIVLQQRPLHAVLFPSFNRTQTLTMCSEVQAAQWTIVHGIAPSPANHWRREAIAQLNRVEMLESATEFDTSTLDYRETLDLLLKIYGESGVDHRLAIAPTGSKMQAVAVGLFRGFMTDVLIVYPTPRGFQRPDYYTQGVREIYSLALADFAMERS